MIITGQDEIMSFAQDRWRDNPQPCYTAIDWDDFCFHNAVQPFKILVRTVSEISLSDAIDKLYGETIFNKAAVSRLQALHIGTDSRGSAPVAGAPLVRQDRGSRAAVFGIAELSLPCSAAGSSTKPAVLFCIHM